MNRHDVDWAGYLPAVVTPFTREGVLDPDTLTALIEHYVDRGMHGLLVNGTCGEWFSQTIEERMVVAETAVAAAAGRARVIAEFSVDALVSRTIAVYEERLRAAAATNGTSTEGEGEGEGARGL